MKARFLKFGWVQFAAMLGLVAVGTVTIWSAGNARAGAVFHGMWRTNLTTACVGLAVYLALAFSDYRKVLDRFAVLAYAVALAMLVLVLFAGSTVCGGRRWLWFFQPSEVSKLAVIGMVAYLFGGPDAPLARLARSFRGFAAAGVVVGLPLVLILAEPDLGTALTLVPAVVAMLFAARVWRRGLVILLAVAAVGTTAVLGAVYEAEKPGTSPERRAAILKALPLRPHQVKRVRVYLFPEEDQKVAGYNLRQAKIAIGSGGASGKGLGKGETNRLKYLPPSVSMNDFIFCVFAEENGFVGSGETHHLLGTLQLLALYGVLLVACGWTAFRAADPRGRLVALGVSTLLFAHVYVNVAMSLGLVPITGLPLPFLSSGRTFLLTTMAGLGLVQSVRTNKPDFTRSWTLKRKEGEE